MNHTPEPWICPTASASKYGFPRWQIGYADGDTLGSVATVDRATTAEQRQANARRIVAAVNACAGIPIEALEGGAIKHLITMARASMEMAERFAPEEVAKVSEEWAQISALLKELDG